MDKNNEQIVRVAIQRPLYKLLDYNWAPACAPKVGMRIKVPLGNRFVPAIVVQINAKSELQKLKSVADIIDQESLFDNTMFAFLEWASRYYFYPLGEVLFHALPAKLRKERKLPETLLWRANHQAYSLKEGTLKRAPKQLTMLQLLKQKECSAQQLQDAIGKNWKKILSELQKKGLVEHRKLDGLASNTLSGNSGDAENTISPESPKKKINLSPEQKQCIAEIKKHFNCSKPKPTLLHGVTGSGKTEVYLRSIEDILKAGKQVLVLVPEIGLVPQTLLRFKEHFPQYQVVAHHSGLNESQRLQNWLGARAAQINIIIGTRSAVFAPMKNPGAILVDEEHDASYKQQEGFLYHARDLAIKRAQLLEIPILLGSATPSLESLHNVKKQRYLYLRLGSRPGKRLLPRIVIQDIRQQQLDAGISSLMMKQIRQHIENHHQVMLFLNRRGFAPVLMCPQCGWHAACEQCDTGMTYHAAAHKIICHHCGSEKKIKPLCPECGNHGLTTQGQGTERIEQVLKNNFPEIPVIRIDRDSISKKGALEAKLSLVRKGKPVILIGTQMLTKGHDFSNLTLVGILDVDQALFSMDFRAQERLAQQIIQVSGRAGRDKIKGQVVLQTAQPEHPLLLNLLTLGYYKTAENILDERRLWRYPPYAAQALIRVSSSHKNAAQEFLMKLRNELQTLLDGHSDFSEKQLEIFGPIPSPLAKRANRYRFQLLFSASKRGFLHYIMTQALEHLVTFRKTGGVRWAIDIDPIDFL